MIWEWESCPNPKPSWAILIERVSSFNSSRAQNKRCSHTKSTLFKCQNASELSHPGPWIPCSHQEFHIFQVLRLDFSDIFTRSEPRFPFGEGMAQEEYCVLPSGVESGGAGHTEYHMSENIDCLLKGFSVELTDRPLAQHAEGLNLILILQR